MSTASPLFLAIKKTCPFCQAALKLADKYSVKPAVVDVLSGDGQKIKDKLQKETGQSTVPFVFSRGKFIGGYTELKEMPKSFWEEIK